MGMVVLPGIMAPVPFVLSVPELTFSEYEVSNELPWVVKKRNSLPLDGELLLLHPASMTNPPKTSRHVKLRDLININGVSLGFLASGHTWQSPARVKSLSVHGLSVHPFVYQEMPGKSKPHNRMEPVRGGKVAS